MSNLFSEIEVVRQMADDLCQKSENKHVVESEIKTMIANLEDINQRLHYVYQV